MREHTVKVAYDGAEGLEVARSFRPEIVLCDIGLPGMDGFEVARAFRADVDLREIFLVALSGYALPEDVQRAKNAGFQDHLAKPPSSNSNISSPKLRYTKWNEWSCYHPQLGLRSPTSECSTLYSPSRIDLPSFEDPTAYAPAAADREARIM